MSQNLISLVLTADQLTAIDGTCSRMSLFRSPMSRFASSMRCRNLTRESFCLIAQLPQPHR